MVSFYMFVASTSPQLLYVPDIFFLNQHDLDSLKVCFWITQKKATPKEKQVYTPWKFNSSPLQMYHSKRKGKSLPTIFL